MSQQYINAGNFPDDPSADTIRLAFEKTDLNFTELYGNLSNIAGNVTAITAGNGISTTSSTGNVTVDALFSSLSTHSNTLIVTGIGGTVPPGGTANSDYAVNAATDTLIIEIDPLSNATFNSVTVTSNLTVNGNVTVPTGNVTLSSGNLVVTGGNITGNILSANANAVQFSGTTGLVTSDTNFTYNSSNTTLTVNGGNIDTQNVTASYAISGAILSIATSAIVYGMLTTTTLLANAVQFVGLTSDPTPSPGLMYYNTTTGKLKVYNGVLSQWDNLN
jgi:hypothetical protein